MRLIQRCVNLIFLSKLYILQANDRNEHGKSDQHGYHFTRHTFTSFKKAAACNSGLASTFNLNQIQKTKKPTLSFKEIVEFLPDLFELLPYISGGIACSLFDIRPCVF